MAMRQRQCHKSCQAAGALTFRVFGTTIGPIGKQIKSPKKVPKPCKNAGQKMPNWCPTASRLEPTPAPPSPLFSPAQTHPCPYFPFPRTCRAPIPSLLRQNGKSSLKPNGRSPKHTWYLDVLVTHMERNLCWVLILAYMFFQCLLIVHVNIGVTWWDELTCFEQTILVTFHDKMGNF